MLTRVSILALVAAAAAVPAPAAEPVHIPHERARLQPRADGTIDMPGLLRELNHTLMKYNADHVLLPLESYLTPEALRDYALEKRAVANEHLTDQTHKTEDVLYYGTAKVGTSKKQSFTIDFDTGSSDFFVPGPKCGKANGCHGKPYNQDGTNEHKTTSITYGSGQVTGDDYLDTVCVAGLCATHTNVISLTNAKGFSKSKSSGLMGMGFQSIAQSKKPPFFQNLISQGKVTKPEFSFYLGREKSHTGQKSQLTLGGKDPSKFKGAAKSHKVTKKGYWQLALDGLAAGGKIQPGTSGQSAIDTGTTVIVVPRAAAISLFSAVPGARAAPFQSGSLTELAFELPCDTKTTVELVFGGTKYIVDQADLILAKLPPGILSGLPLFGGKNKCVASIIGAELNPTEPNFSVVGDSFLKNWYTTFSHAKPASVSFAKSV